MQFEMPQAGPQHEKLHAMVGEWIGEETMFASPWSPEEQQRASRLTRRVHPSAVFAPVRRRRPVGSSATRSCLPRRRVSAFPSAACPVSVGPEFG